MDNLDIIPVERREAARLALAGAFGGSAISALQPVVAGASGALVYKLAAEGKDWLVRLESPERIALRDPARSFACMAIAAEAGVAPPLRRMDAQAGIAIMEFIEGRPLGEFPGGPGALAQAAGALMARLQAGPAFPPLADYGALLGRMLAYIAGSSLFAPGLLAPHIEALARISAAYPWGLRAAVASHNDPNPRNFIYDGKRLWLVDWELSFAADPLADIAILADNFAPTPELEAQLLEGWSGAPPSEALQAQLMLMKPLTRLFYAVILLGGFAARPAVKPDDSLEAPCPATFAAMVGDGRLPPGSPAMLYSLGKMMLAGFLSGANAPGIGEAMARARG